MNLSQVDPKTQSLPLTPILHSSVILYSIPGKSPSDAISLLAKCGIDVITHDLPPEPPKPHNPYRDLAAGVLHQAIHDAFNTEDRSERHKARHWLLYDKDDFAYWCNILDLKPHIVRSILRNRIGSVPPEDPCQPFRCKRRIYVREPQRVQYA